MPISKVKFEGVQKLLAKNKKLYLELSKENRRAIRAEAQILLKDMKRRAPKDKRKLVEALVIKVWKNIFGVIGIVVGITKETTRPEFYGTSSKGKRWFYPAAQEYGFRDRAGKFIINPFIRPTWDFNKRGMKSRIKKTYKAVIAKARM